MAELNTGGDGGKGGKVRSKKSNPGVDLTAMVDLAFLLITFFMLTTSLSKPQSMNLAMPDKDSPKDPTTMNTPDDRSMTILMGKDNTIQWYLGLFDEPLVAPTKTTYGKDGIRQAILQRQAAVKAVYGDDKEKGLIVIIKPTDKTHYKNLVDILDEMAITNVQLYAIGDISKPEIELLEKDGMY
ncbi:biopolymer transporter ExbD [Flavobacterium alkalisoli]|uniref:Biopolymer transporter ExbD n=1 Tax=Flavobacterium alkalisoli TaxID=2602769 RepID=A0A5B9FSW0_9FLAO|nr:biopolymer transporter ExbD [Flavobacterium alkalisoli]QEE49299.1 biopolymer transporter ExbD [Flavobacterium alkalisoli]